MEGLVLADDAALVRKMDRSWAALAAVQEPVLDAALIAALTGDERRLRNEGRWVSGPTTLLEVLRLQWDEVRNCRVVRWLLDPLAPHGLGAASLTSVLGRINELALEQDLDARNYPNAEQATVDVEEARGHTRADIVINGPSWTVVVEAKIRAGEQDEQGRRLSELWPGATYVYLTRKGRQMATAGEEPWISMRWGDLLTAVREAVANQGPPTHTNPRVQQARSAMLDYLHGARRLAR